MASLSDNMKSKRDVKRKSSVLIVDKDLGNFGLYKSILSVEYDLDCINSLYMAANMCASKLYDIIIVDGQFDIDATDIFYKNVKSRYKNDSPILLVLEEKSNKESIIGYLCIGAREYIEKPFTKENITNTLYEQLKKRREYNIRKSVLIVDEDYEVLKELKGYLRDNYNISIVGSYELARQFMISRLPDLIICDIKIFERYLDDACYCDIKELEQSEAVESKSSESESSKSESGESETGESEAGKSESSKLDLGKLDKVKLSVPVLVTMNNPNGELIAKCAKYKPEGFLMKPVEKDMLQKALERIFLMESYTGQVR